MMKGPQATRKSAFFLDNSFEPGHIHCYNFCGDMDMHPWIFFLKGVCACVLRGKNTMGQV